MGKICLFIHGKLNYFTEPKWKKQSIEYEFNGKVSLKHILESLGVPHPEVGLVKLNGKPLDLNYHVQDQDLIDVYPYDVHSNLLPPDNIRFILDNNLGKLTDYLRLLGFDTLYNPAWDDKLIAEQAAEQNRILLSRDRGLLKRKIVNLGYCVRADLPRDQVDEVIQHYGIEESVRPFKRCPRCNGMLEKVEKQEITDQLQPLTRIYYDEFMRCSDCGQIYWKGSHYEHMQEFIAKFENKKFLKG